MDPTQKLFPNGAGASDKPEAMKKFDMEDILAETYRGWSDLDQAPDYASNHLFDARPEFKPSPEYFNSKLDGMIDISASAFFNRVTENSKAPESIFFTEILQITMNDCYRYKETVNDVIKDAKSKYSELENSDTIEAFLRLLQNELTVLGEHLSQETIASIQVISASRSSVAYGRIPLNDKICNFCKSTGHVKRYCPILNNSRNQFEGH